MNFRVLLRNRCRRTWSSIIRHGGIIGISKASGQREACAAINAFLKDKFANRTWTSIAVLRNPKIGLHRDVCNLAGHLNHAGKTFTMKDCEFDARRYHQIEPHEGCMWALAAAPQAFCRITNAHAADLLSLNFRCQQTLLQAHALTPIHRPANGPL